MPSPTILVVDDDPDLVEALRYNLERESYRVLTARDGEAALRQAEARPDGVILDLMLPKIDGFGVCRRLRDDAATRDIPILILSAKAQEDDVVRGLELGADDYLTKPFSPRELVARLRSLLRRTRSRKEDRLAAGPFRMDMVRHALEVDGKALDLTVTEFNLLRQLLSQPGRVFTRNQLIDAARGGEAEIYDRTVDVHIVSLRRKLGRKGSWVETVRGVGYRLREEER